MLQVFSGVPLFDGEAFIADAALVVEAGRIAAIVPHAERPRGGRQIDLGGGILAPGLIDWQVNGGGGVLFNETPTAAGIAAIAAAHRRDGTTALLPTVITAAPAGLAAALEAARQTAPGCLGIHVEGPFIDPRRAGAHPPAYVRAMTSVDAAQLVAARAGAMVVTLAPRAAAPELIALLAGSGIVVSLGHAEASAEEAQECFAAGASAVTHLYNAMSQLSGRAPGLVGATLAAPGIICGLIADGHHVHAAAVRAALAAKGPRGIALVSDAMPPAAGGPDSFVLQGRRVTRTDTRLALEDGTLAGAAITLMDAVRWLVRELGLDLAAALQMATLTPARLLRLEREIGSLRPGGRADLVHLGAELDVKRTWLAGEAS